MAKNWNIRLSKGLEYAFFLQFLQPLYPRSVSSTVLGIFVVLAVLKFYTYRRDAFDYKLFLTGAVLYILFLVSLVYSQDLGFALRKLSTALPILLYPLCMALIGTTEQQKLFNKITVGAVLYTGATILLTFSDPSFYINMWNGDPFENHLFYNDLEPLYLSLHLGVAGILVVYLYVKLKNKWQAALAALVAGFLFVLLLQLSLKSTIVPFIIAMGILALYSNRLKLWVFFAASIVALLAFDSYSVNFSTKFSQLLYPPPDMDITVVHLQRVLRECTLSLVPRAGLFGFGIGDGHQSLVDCYITKGSNLNQISYNTHNQYVSILLNIGVLGTLCFAAVTLMGLYRIISNKRYLGVTVLLFLGVVMLSENILERQYGVMLYALFFNVFLMGLFVKKKRKRFKIPQPLK